MADVSALKDRLRDRYRTVAELAAERCLEDTIKAAPFRENASIVDSLTVTDVREVGDWVFEVEIGSPADTALWTDEGTRPHVIEAVNAKVLAFEVGGQMVFRRRVYHPGNAAQHWFRVPMPERWSEAVQTALASAGD